MSAESQERWLRGVERLTRLNEARRQQPRALREAAERVYEERLLDEDTLARIERLKHRLNEFGYDPFGFNPDFLRYALPLAIWLYRHYFRVQTHGIENIPQGSALLIANHSGQLPMDGMMIATACFLERDPPQMLRSMVERWVPSLPFVSWFFVRAGQIVGTRDNFRRLVQQGDSILVFPEGVVGINKTYDKAYQLQQFGYGFMRLALENKLPIVPVAVIGAEEQAMSFYNARKLGKVLGMPAFPITPTFPWLGPLGMLPLPVKYHLHFGAPLRFEGNPDDEDRVIAAMVDEFKVALQGLIDEGLKARTGVFR